MSEHEKTILHGFAVLAGRAPSKSELSAHRSYIDTHGYATWIAALNQEFSGISDADLGALLARNTRLNMNIMLPIKIKSTYNSSVDPENIQMATEFIAANAGNRIGAILDFLKAFSMVTTPQDSTAASDLSGIIGVEAGRFNAQIQANYDFATSEKNWHALSNVTHTLTQGNDIFAKAPDTQTATIEAGTGADAIFTGNTGAKAVWVFGTTASPHFRNSADYDPNGARLNAIKPLPEQSFGSWGVGVSVNYRGLRSKVVNIDDLNDYQATYQELHQAIQIAINDDAVLSKLLVASDGPSGSLIVHSKTDGSQSSEDLTVDLIFPDESMLSDSVIKNYYIANQLSDFMPNSFYILAIDMWRMSGLGSGKEYKPVIAQDEAGKSIWGTDGFVPSDNIIKPGIDSDEDLIVLDTTSTVFNEQASSNDIIKYEGVFGNDTIVNFSWGSIAHGGNLIDFSAFFRAASPRVFAYHAAPASAGNTVEDGKIEVFRYDITDVERNDSAAAVKQLYNDMVGQPTANTELYIAEYRAHVRGSFAASYDLPYSGHVYKVTDGPAANDLTVELLGKLTLSDLTDNAGWSKLSSVNFL